MTIENAIGGQGNDTFILPGNLNQTVDGGGGFNTLDFSAAGTPMTFDLRAGTVSKDGNSTGTDHFSHIQQFIGGGNDDTFIGATGNFTLDGGAGHDTLDYSWDTLAITVDTTNSVVNKGSVPVKHVFNGSDNFTHIETFIGGSGHDTFIGGLGSHDFVGTGDTNANIVLDETASTTPNTFDLQAGTVTKNDTSVSTGGSRTGPGNPLQLKAADSFSDIQTFLGGSSSDVFKNILGGHGIFDGGAGTDTLDYSSNVNGLSIDLQHGTVDRMYLVNGQTREDGIKLLIPVQATDTFSNIEMFKGGSGADKVIDGPGSHSFDGGGGTNTVVLHDPYANYIISHYLGTDNLMHTVLVDTLGASGDGRLDLVHVQTWQDPGHSGFLV